MNEAELLKGRDWQIGFTRKKGKTGSICILPIKRLNLDKKSQSG